MGEDDFLRYRLDKKLSELAQAANQLPNNHDVNVTNMIPAVETGLATSAKQLADGHNVNVSNMITAVETGLNKEVTQLNIDSLIYTLQELISKISFLSSVKQHQNESLRVTALPGSTTAVTGSLTGVTGVTTLTTLTNFGTAVPASLVAEKINNQLVTLANINNCVGI